LLFLSYAGTDFDQSQYAKVRKVEQEYSQEKAYAFSTLKMTSPPSSPDKSYSEQGSPYQDSKSSIEGRAPRKDANDHGITELEHDISHDNGEGDGKSSDQGKNNDLDLNRDLGAGWTFPLFGHSTARVVALLSHTIDRIVDDSNVSCFLPSALKNRLFHGQDESFTPVLEKLKREAQTMATTSVKSIKKIA
jgi:hypothetical protein